jgi:hypothetical protein
VDPGPSQTSGFAFLMFFSIRLGLVSYSEKRDGSDWRWNKVLRPASVPMMCSALVGGNVEVRLQRIYASL